MYKQVFIAAVCALVMGVSAQAEGNAEDGEAVFKKCRACHAVGDGAKNKVGPVLNDIIGRTAGTVEGFKYSSAMAEKGEEGLVWDDETLTAYLSDPRGYIPKNRMAFPGLKKPQEVEDVIAYLEQFSGN